MAMLNNQMVYNVDKQKGSQPMHFASAVHGLTLHGSAQLC